MGGLAPGFICSSIFNLTFELPGPDYCASFRRVYDHQSNRSTTLFAYGGRVGWRYPAIGTCRDHNHGCESPSRQPERVRQRWAATGFARASTSAHAPCTTETIARPITSTGVVRQWKLTKL